MYDLHHEWGGDLAVGSGGDLAISTGADTINQRVYRRLLTNAGDYIWNLDYGGGLAAFVGKPADSAAIEAIIRAQLALETAIPTTTDPQVSVRLISPAIGCVVATVTYEDPSSSAPIQLSISTA